MRLIPATNQESAMKVINKKPICYNDSFWNAGSVIEIEKNTAEYFIGMGTCVLAPKDAELSPVPDTGPERQSLETVAMEKAAASIVNAVAKAAIAPAAKPNEGK